MFTSPWQNIVALHKRKRGETENAKYAYVKELCYIYSTQALTETRLYFAYIDRMIAGMAHIYDYSHGR